jgi:hypothetical protein
MATPTAPVPTSSEPSWTNCAIAGRRPQSIATKKRTVATISAGFARSKIDLRICAFRLPPADAQALSPIDAH